MSRQNFLNRIIQPDSSPSQGEYQIELDQLRKFFDVKIHNQPYLVDIINAESSDDTMAVLSLSCRGQIGEEFIQEALESSDFLFTISYPLSEEWQQIKLRDKSNRPDNIVAFAIVKTNSNDRSAYLYLICASPIKFGNSILPLQLGLILHGWVVRYLLSEDISTIYLHAANLQLIPYYASLGYEVSDDECRIKSIAKPNAPLSWLTKWFKKVETPKFNITTHGVQMRLCNSLSAPLLEKSQIAIEKCNQILQQTIKDKLDLMLLQPELYNPLESQPITLGEEAFNARKVKYVWDHPKLARGFNKPEYYDKEFLEDVADYNPDLRVLLDSSPVPPLPKFSK